MQIGDKVPDFEFEFFQDTDFHKAKLSDYRQGWLILIFYPADLTFVCPTELSQAQELYPQFKELNAEVISISTDTVQVHKSWHKNAEAIQKIEFPMASDPSFKICQLFNTLIKEEGISRRATCIIDPDRVLKSLEIQDNDFGRNIEETLRKLQAAIYVRTHEGEVCPANWHPGEAAIVKPVEVAEQG